MSSVRMARRTLWVLFIFCVAPVFYAIAFRAEIYPWSSFPMYSGVNTGKDLFLLSAYAVDALGNETPLEQTGILRPKYEYRWRLKAEKLQDRELTSEELNTLQRFAEIFKEDLQLKELKFRGLKFYLEHWNSFTGPTRHHPDQRRLLYEQAL